MVRLSLSLLGPFQAALDGEPIVAFESNKVRALLAYLAVEADRPHSREKLAGLLWPERSDQDASANLRYALSNLRAAIENRAASPPFLLVSRQTIQFDPAGDAWVDATAFGELLASPAPSLSDLEQAVNLYGGEFLEGFFVGDSVAFEEWALLKREQLDRQMRSALHHLAAMHEQRGEYERALSYAWRQVELDPWQGQARRQLMRLLALSGQRAAALAQYEAFRRALAEELGVEPGRATTELYEQIRDGKEGLDERGDRPPVDEALVNSVAVPLSPAQHRLSRRMKLALAAGLTALVVVAAILLFVAGNTLFRSGTGAASTLLPAPDMSVEGKLVFLCEELYGDDSASPPQICVTDYRTGRRAQVTDDLKFDGIGCLAWSPDGQQIVFGASLPGRTSRLYIVDADGSGLRQLTGGEMPDTDSAWSPDGQWIVFTRMDDLWLVRPDGSEAHALLAVSDSHLSRAVWSPDSRRIAFLQGPIERNSLHGEVWVVNRDGTAPRQIYAFERSEDEGVFLGWSPDGRHVGCFFLGSGGSTALLIDADGSGEVQVMEEVLESWLPEYWPPWGGVE
ncbi:MAG: PD40 domain-containing protein [Anaerolineae bacterium]|nr:PD40 domain-containing protein [Anaerolineae bacterium]